MHALLVNGEQVSRCETGGSPEVRRKVCRDTGRPVGSNQAEHGLWCINRRLRWPVGQRHEPRSRGVGRPEMTIAGMQSPAASHRAGKVMDAYVDGRPLI